MIPKFVSSKAVIAKIYNDLNIQEEGRFASIVEWIGEALELVGCTDNLESKTAVISINNYRGVLPCDFEYEIAIKHDGVNIVYNSSLQKDLLHELFENNSQNTFHPNTHSYSINFPYINYTLRDCDIELLYKGLRIDGEGLPLVPDLIQFKEGCVLYVMSKFTMAKYNSGKVGYNEYKAIKEEAMKMLDKAASHIQMPNPAKMQSIAQRWQRLIPNILDFEQSFITANALQVNRKP